MTETLVTNLMDWLNGRISSELICFLLSMAPILELRGGMLAASFLGLPLKKAFIVCIAGNIIPIPFLLLLIEKILVLMERFSLTRGFALWLRKKSDKNRSLIDKYGFWGLVLLVGVPLPGTGAWTGSLVASLLHMPKKQSLPACVLGVLMAALIMAVVSYGLLGTVLH